MLGPKVSLLFAPLPLTLPLPLSKLTDENPSLLCWNFLPRDSRGEERNPWRHDEVWNDSPLSPSPCPPSHTHSFSTDRVADIIARARASTQGTAANLKSDSAGAALGGIAMARRNANPPPSTSVLSAAATHKASMSLLGTDSEDEELEMRMLPSGRGRRGAPSADSISLLDRFEASGITSGGGGGGKRNQRTGRSRARGDREIDSASPEVSSPMHSAPATPLRERTPRYASGESDGEEGGAL
jgi:hypothetical protein